MKIIKSLKVAILAPLALLTFNVEAVLPPHETTQCHNTDKYQTIRNLYNGCFIQANNEVAKLDTWGVESVPSSDDPRLGKNFVKLHSLNLDGSVLSEQEEENLSNEQRQLNINELILYMDGFVFDEDSLTQRLEAGFEAFDESSSDMKNIAIEKGISLVNITTKSMGDNSIQDNILATKDLIKLLRNLQTNMASPMVALGHSLGGVYLRYALLDLENPARSGTGYAFDHNVSMFVTYDSPHKGAHIPVGMQTAVQTLEKVIKNIEETADIPNIIILKNFVENYKDKCLPNGGDFNFGGDLDDTLSGVTGVLDSQAAKQILISHHGEQLKQGSSSIPTLNQEFQSYLATSYPQASGLVAFPSKSQNYLLSNGPITIHTPQNSTMDNEYLIDIHAISATRFRNLSDGNFHCKKYRIHLSAIARRTDPSLYANNEYSSKIEIWTEGHGVSLPIQDKQHINISESSNGISANAKNFDNEPGSYSNITAPESAMSLYTQYPLVQSDHCKHDLYITFDCYAPQLASFLNTLWPARTAQFPLGQSGTASAIGAGNLTEHIKVLKPTNKELKYTFIPSWSALDIDGVTNNYTITSNTPSEAINRADVHHVASLSGNSSRAHNTIKLDEITLTAIKESYNKKQWLPAILQLLL